MDNITVAESLLAEQAAQSTLLTFLTRAILILAAREGVERNVLLQKWEQRGNELLSGTVFGSISQDRLSQVREAACVRFTDLIMTASREK
jgi:hypothetical protein